MKKLKTLKDNEKLESITNNFPEDIQIAEEILDIIAKEKTGQFTRPKIEQSENTKTSLYIVVTNKILIANMKNNYARIQTIAHECIHSSQSKAFLFLNFIISNVNMLMFLIITGLTLFSVIKINILLALGLTCMLLTQFSIRIYLEIDAMKRARHLAEEYINSKTVENNALVVSKEDIAKLLESYDKLNEQGIPFMIDHYFTRSIIPILIYIVMAYMLLS